MKLEPVDQTKLEAAIAEGNQLYRLDSITFNEKNHVLNPAYDASGACLDGIEEVLKSHSVELGHNWWTHCKESYYQFVEGNVKENARYQPWSCHQIPPGAGRKR